MENKLQHTSRTVVFKEGAPAENLYIIKRGEILCLKSSKDRLIPVFLAGEGDIIGESAMVSKLPYTYTAITLSEVELISVPSNNFKEVFLKAPDWLTELTTTMIYRFQNTSSLIAENRLIHPSIIKEDKFSPETEVEFKKLLS